MQIKRRRLYIYSAIICTVLITLLSIQPIRYNIQLNNQDIKNIPPGTKLSLRCDISTQNEYFKMPDILWFDNLTKIKTWFGITYDHWTLHVTEAKIKVSPEAQRDYVPKNEFLVISEPVIKTKDKYGKIIYTIPLKEPPELSEIILSSYIDHYTGFLGHIAYLFDVAYPKNINIKQFKRVMGCIDEVIHPDKENTNVRYKR